ncbi:MAG: tetratricopeptide repeat protein [Bacteroidota bacterium]
MKTVKTHSSILGPSGCINKEAFLDYFNNKLVVDEIQIFETHVSQCLLCSDAFDGFATHTNAFNLPSEISLLKKEISKTYSPISLNGVKKKNNKRFMVMGISIAASILLVITSYFLFNIQTNHFAKEVAFENYKTEQKKLNAAEEAKSVANNPIEKTMVLPEQNTVTLKDLSDENLKEKKQLGEVKTVDFEVTTTKNSQDYKSTLQAKSDILSGGLKDEQQNSNTIEQTDQIPLAASTGYRDAGVDVNKMATGRSVNLEEVQVHQKKEKHTEDKVAEVSKSVSATEATPNINTAIVYYNSADYDNSIAECNGLINTNTKSYAAIYYLAMSYYQTNQKGKAIIELDKLIKDKNNSFYELALWQKATILVEENKNDKAKDLLNEIVKYSGSMKNNALKKIDELDNPK